MKVGSRKDYCKIEQENNFCNNVFCYENELTYPVYVSDHKFKEQIRISQIMCILKILTDLCIIRQNVRLKSTFADIVYNVLLVKEF